MDKQEILDRHEFGTYLDGLRDALELKKPEIRKMIQIIEESEE